MEGRPSFVKMQLRRAGKLDIDILEKKFVIKSSYYNKQYENSTELKKLGVTGYLTTCPLLADNTPLYFL